MNVFLSYLHTFGASFLLTLLLELIIAMIFRMRGRDLLLFLLVNLLTNPAAVYIDTLFRSLFFDVSAFAWQIPTEAAVVAVEGWLYARSSVSLRSPWMFAVAANVFSYGLGLILNYIS